MLVLPNEASSCGTKGPRPTSLKALAQQLTGDRKLSPRTCPTPLPCTLANQPLSPVLAYSHSWPPSSYTRASAAPRCPPWSVRPAYLCPRSSSTQRPFSPHLTSTHTSFRAVLPTSLPMPPIPSPRLPRLWTVWLQTQPELAQDSGLHCPRTPRVATLNTHRLDQEHTMTTTRKTDGRQGGVAAWARGCVLGMLGLRPLGWHRRPATSSNAASSETPGPPGPPPASASTLSSVQTPGRRLRPLLGKTNISPWHWAGVEGPLIPAQ